MRPFVAASWHGHRNDPDVPKAVRDVWREKFNHRGVNGRRVQGQQSNVDLAVLDSKGDLIHWFDGYRRLGGQRLPEAHRRESLADYTSRELEKAISDLNLDGAPTGEHPMKLPDPGQSGIRIFVSLREDRMRAYRAPVVEAVSLKRKDWKPLKYPQGKQTIEAASLKKWLSQVYPPGIMERTNPQTKKVYQITKVEGELSLEPAGSSGKMRYALLRGKIRLTDEGPDNFTYDGDIEIVLTYNNSKARPLSLRGIFDGIYPRYNPMQRRSRDIPLQAAFESLPMAANNH